MDELEDERMVVEDTTSYPYSVVGLLRLNLDTSSPTWCTAALVGPHHVLTAAHCVINPETGVHNASEVLPIDVGVAKKCCMSMLALPALASLNA